MATYQLGNFCIDEVRPIKVVVIGAGYGGTPSPLPHNILTLNIHQALSLAFGRLRTKISIYYEGR